MKTLYPKNKDYILVPIILILALFSRLYRLNDFPYFPISDYPWVGTDSGALKGLYIDERVYSNLATNLINNPSSPTLYQPWLQLFMVGASVSVLGQTPFAVRLPSAVMSSISVVLVYLICVKIFKSRLAASISSLYLIVMTPAIILNRMNFLENGVTLFFLGSFLCLLQYSEKNERKYLVLGSIFAGLSVFCKINGLIAPIFLLLYLMRERKLRENIKPIALLSIPALLFLIIVSITQNLDFLQLISQFVRQWRIGKIGDEFSMFSYMLFNSLPSGYITSWGSYFRLEYWYIIAYFALAYMAASEFEKVSDSILAIASFLCLFLAIGGFGVYYLILIQPFLAIPIGYAVVKLTRMKTFTTIFFYIFLYAPVVLSVDIYLSMTDKLGSPILTDPFLTVLKIVNVLLPLLLVALTPILEKKLTKDFRTIMNTAIIAAFFVFLFIGSYVLPVFYPHYLSPMG